MSLRVATPEDAASLAALSIEVWLNTYIRDGISAFFADYALATFTADSFRRILSDAREHLIVSDNAVGIDGFARLTANAPAPVAGCSDTELTTLYVQPRHQGRGLGARLLTQAVERCRRTGVLRPWLAVNAENAGALRFYAAQGFETVGETGFTIGDRVYPNHVLARDLRR